MQRQCFLRMRVCALLISIPLLKCHQSIKYVVKFDWSIYWIVCIGNIRAMDSFFRIFSTPLHIANSSTKNALIHSIVGFFFISTFPSHLLSVAANLDDFDSIMKVLAQQQKLNYSFENIELYAFVRFCYRRIRCFIGISK